MILFGMDRSVLVWMVTLDIHFYAAFLKEKETLSDGRLRATSPFAGAKHHGADRWALELSRSKGVGSSTRRIHRVKANHIMNLSATCAAHQPSWSLMKISES
jgi:hypothetical protein